MKHLILILSILLCQAAYAANWEYVGKGLGNDLLYIDTSSIQYGWSSLTPPQRLITFWAKHLNKNIDYHIEGKKVWFTLYKDIINCETSSYSSFSALVYSVDGSIITSENGHGWRAIPPDSVIDAYKQLLCTPKAN